VLKLNALGSCPVLFLSSQGHSGEIRGDLPLPPLSSQPPPSPFSSPPSSLSSQPPPSPFSSPPSSLSSQPPPSPFSSPPSSLSSQPPPSPFSSPPSSLSSQPPPSPFSSHTPPTSSLSSQPPPSKKSRRECRKHRTQKVFLYQSIVDQRHLHETPSLKEAAPHCKEKNSLDTMLRV
ncbi:hypothetical protein KUCAC02_020903, partial [Chaenocephalus aceratus]